MEATLSSRTFFPRPDVPLFVRRYDAIGEIAMHGHDFHELVMVVRGTSDHVVADGRRERTARVGSGDVFVLGLDERHGYRRSRGFSVWNIMFAPEMLRPDAAALRAVPGVGDLLFVEPVFRRESRLDPRLRLLPGERAAIQATTAALAEELDAARDGFAIAARGLFLHLLVQFGRAWRRASAGGRAAALSAGQDSALAEAFAFMEEHHGDEDLTVASVAAAAGLSPHWFSELFAKRTGLPPWQWLTNLRIERAKRLLDSQDWPVIRIALEVGFADPSYFARVFRAQTGLTPRAWRARTGG
jgi:AraC family L-rhamnose operon regulatory protein RhaS